MNRVLSIDESYAVDAKIRTMVEAPNSREKSPTTIVFVSQLYFNRLIPGQIKPFS